MSEVNKATIKQLIEYVASSLVDEHKDVKVKESTKDNYTVMELSVSPVDLGKVIGKNGQTADCFWARMLRRRRLKSQRPQA